MHPISQHDSYTRFLMFVAAFLDKGKYDIKCNICIWESPLTKPYKSSLCFLRLTVRTCVVFHRKAWCKRGDKKNHIFYDLHLMQLFNFKRKKTDYLSLLNSL